MQILKIKYIKDNSISTCVKMALFEFLMTYRPGETKLHTDKGIEIIERFSGFICDFHAGEIKNKLDDKGNEIPVFVYMLYNNTWAICEDCFNSKYKILLSVDEKDINKISKSDDK